MSNASDTMVLDFNEPSACQWQAVDDRIMGGASQSQPEDIDGIGLRFSGRVSLENNGGFASIRSSNDQYNLSAYSGLILRLRGDGKRYKLSLRTDRFFDGVSYQVAFATEKDVWQEITLPFADFTPTHHGIKLSTVPSVDTAKVTSFGLFISERQEGPFQCDIAWIKGAE